MARAFYIGVGGTARRAKNVYLGVDGKARKVKKIYVGVDGKARLAYQSYTPVTGISLNVSYRMSKLPVFPNTRYRYRAVIDATLSPSNATNQTITWKMNFGSSHYLKEKNIALSMAPTNDGRHLELGGYYNSPFLTTDREYATYTLVGTTPDGVSVRKTVKFSAITYKEDDDYDTVLEITVS